MEMVPELKESWGWFVEEGEKRSMAQRGQEGEAVPTQEKGRGEGLEGLLVWATANH